MEPDRWLGLDLRHLVALKTIADEGSFGRAAEKLGYTQSAISQQIATLERIVGMRLIERPGGPRPISLTEAGAILLRHADAIQARLLAAKADMKALEAGDAGRLRIGTFQSVGTRILPTLLRRFSDAHPDVEVVLQESSDERELLDLVERGELDLTFWTLPVSAGPYESVELLRDPYVLVVPADSPRMRRFVSSLSPSGASSRSTRAMRAVTESLANEQSRSCACCSRSATIESSPRAMPGSSRRNDCTTRRGTRQASPPATPCAHSPWLSLVPSAARPNRSPACSRSSSITRPAAWLFEVRTSPLATA